MTRFARTMDILYANDRPGVYPDSYYFATAVGVKDRPGLDRVVSKTRFQHDVTCDVCVVGGGYTGLSTALHLAERGLDVVLLEAHRVGWGASGRNGGQVGSGQRVDQERLEKMFGLDHARRLWKIGEQAKQKVRDLIARHEIACDYKPGVLHADHRARYVPHSHKHAEKLQRDYGYDKIRGVDRSEICDMLGTTAYYGGTLDLGAGHLHPLNYALGLARAAEKAGVRIFERTRVVEIGEGDPARVKTAPAAGSKTRFQHEVRARFVALACNGYLGQLNKSIARRVMPINNYILATEPLGEATARALIRDDVAVADSRFVVNYFRLSADNRLLFGGGESYGYRFPDDIAAFVRKPCLKIFPQLAGTKIDYAWGGTLAITMNRLPYFQRLGPNILSAGGYSGHGVALATLAGEIVADAIAGMAERFDLMAGIPGQRFPGGPAMRQPLLALAMAWYSLRDRL